MLQIMKDMKYILVTGGVISGIGKGVVASSLGVLLKHCGVEVTSIKIDPYINIGMLLLVRLSFLNVYLSLLKKKRWSTIIPTSKI